MTTNAGGAVSVPWFPLQSGSSPPRNRVDSAGPAVPSFLSMSSSFSLAAGPAGPGTPATPATPSDAGPGQAKRSVCDHCRRRRIRCDGKQPCQPCTKATLVCKRDHIPLKRGPKRGRGRVINELRGLYAVDAAATASPAGSNPGPPSPRPAAVAEKSKDSSEDRVDPALSTDNTPQPPPFGTPWQHNASGPRHAREPSSVFSSGQYRPTTRSYFDLVPRCVELYYEHIYPIMPLPYMPSLHAMVARAGTFAGGLSHSERSYLFALCALTCFHMSGQSIGVAAPKPSWETAGRFFLDECIAARQAYDFFGDASLNALASSFWLSTSFFEINQSRKSWLYLREALTLAQDMRLHDDAAYEGLDPAEQLCRLRMFWQLFVTERSFAILRSKPITLKKTPALPSARHPYEAPEIHSGFLLLISSFSPLDESFVNAWNEGSDPRVTANTYLALQRFLALPPPFLMARKHQTMPPPRTRTLSMSHYAGGSSGDHPPFRSVSAEAGIGIRSMTCPSSPTGQQSDWHDQKREPGSDDHNGADATNATNAASTASAADRTDAADADAVLHPETTDIQKADLLVTQQWLRLIVWQSSFRQQLLSWTAADESMRFAFPLTIASRTAAVIQSLPPQAIEVHGMGIFEKIFEIGTWSMNVLQAYKRSPYGGGGGGGGAGGGSGSVFRGYDSGGAGDGGRLAYAVDPLAFFVRTLSASPNSRKQFAERLLLFAGDHAGSPGMTLSPPGSASMAASMVASSPSSFSLSFLPSSATSTTPASPSAASSTELFGLAAAAAAAAVGNGAALGEAVATGAAASTVSVAATTATAEPPEQPLASSSLPSSPPSSLAGIDIDGLMGAGAGTAVAASTPTTAPLAGLPTVVGAAVGAGDHHIPFGGDWAAPTAAAAGIVAIGGPGDSGGDGGSDGGSGLGYTSFSEDLEAVSVGYDEDVSKLSRRSSSSFGAGGGWAGEGWPPFHGEFFPSTDARWA